MVRKYRPSNGTEGMSFVEAWCDHCIKHSISPEAKKQCPILRDTFIYDSDDPEYPEAWQYQNGRPVCTAFKSREEANAKRRNRRVIASDKATPDLFS